MIKFRTGEYNKDMIVEVEVERESDSSVWIKGRRNNKRSTYENYFDSWDEAKAYLLEKAESKAASCRRQLEYANGILGNIKGLKNPNT